MKKVFAGIAVLAMGVLAVPAGTTMPAYAATDYTIGQFNMAGGNNQYGKLGLEAADALVRSVTDRKPTWLTLQETCADWNGRLESKLAEYGMVFNAVKRSKGGAAAQCKHATPFGNSILFRKDFGFEPPDRKQVYDLQSPSGMEQRELLCIKAPSKKVAVCTVHLTNGNNKEQLQARRHEAEVARKNLAEKYAGYQIFLGGDLNDDPLSAVTDNFYHATYGSGAHGSYKEVDSPCGNTPSGRTGCRSGHPTHGNSKIDYIYVSPSVKIVRVVVSDAKYSDHRLPWSVISF